MSYQGLSYSELYNMPTLCVGQTDNLKIETPDTRVWLARTGVEDGEPFNNRVTIEAIIDRRWKVVAEFQGRG